MNTVGSVTNNAQSAIPMRAAQTVFVVDSDDTIRRSLKAAISDTGWQVETFASAQEFLAGAYFAGPSCLILDVRHLGFNLLKRLADCAYLRVILINGYSDVLMNVHAIKTPEPFVSHRLLSAIRYAIECSQMAVRREQQIEALRACYDSLTAREREVMATVVEGQLNKQIAYKLGLSEITVKAHRGKVMSKMKARSLADLVRMAACLGISPVQVATEPLPYRSVARSEAEKSSFAISIPEGGGLVGITMA
jgi:FixJ family two-component response regulator